MFSMLLLSNNNSTPLTQTPKMSILTIHSDITYIWRTFCKLYDTFTFFLWHKTSYTFKLAHFTHFNYHLMISVALLNSVVLLTPRPQRQFTIAEVNYMMFNLNYNPHVYGSYWAKFMILFVCNAGEYFTGMSCIPKCDASSCHF